MKGRVSCYRIGVEFGIRGQVLENAYGWVSGLGSGFRVGVRFRDGV